MKDDDFEATEEDIAPPVFKPKQNASQRVYKKLMKIAQKPSLHLVKADSEDADADLYSLAEHGDDDDYKDDELKDDLGSFKKQEKNAMNAPLRTQDMAGIENEGMNLMKEITGSVQGMENEDQG
jgi:hypothetical protein